MDELFQESQDALEKDNISNSSNHKKEAPSSAQATSKSEFRSHINAYLHSLDSLRWTFPGLAQTLGVLGEGVANKTAEFLKTHGVRKDSPEDSAQVNFSIPAERAPEIKKLMKSLQRVHLTDKLIHHSLLVMYVSQFDVLLSSLMGGIFHCQPELLNSCEKNLTVSDVLKFSSIDAVRLYCIEREVESVLRRSHADHFNWLEAKLAIPLRKGLEIWPDFIELTERRNLLVHTDGLVSSQYISVCRLHGCDVSKLPRIGERVIVDQPYLDKAFCTLVNIGVKLGYVVWRRLIESEGDAADDCLNGICVELICQQHYDLAIELLRFPEANRRKVSRTTHLLMTLNIAQALKWKGQHEQALRVLSSIDFDPLADLYKLANEVLVDNFDKAEALMRKIGNSGRPTRIEYYEWPIFKEFRCSDQFRRAYRDVFDSDLDIRDVDVEPLSLLGSLQGRNEGQANRGHSTFSMNAPTDTRSAPAPFTDPASEHPE